MSQRIPPFIKSSSAEMGQRERKQNLQRSSTSVSAVRPTTSSPSTSPKPMHSKAFTAHGYIPSPFTNKGVDLSKQKTQYTAGKYAELPLQALPSTSAKQKWRHRYPEYTRPEQKSISQTKQKIPSALPLPSSIKSFSSTPWKDSYLPEKDSKIEKSKQSFALSRPEWQPTYTLFQREDLPSFTYDPVLHSIFDLRAREALVEQRTLEIVEKEEWSYRVARRIAVSSIQGEYRRIHPSLVKEYMRNFLGQYKTKKTPQIETKQPNLLEAYKEKLKLQATDFSDIDSSETESIDLGKEKIVSKFKEQKKQSLPTDVTKSSEALSDYRQTSSETEEEPERIIQSTKKATQIPALPTQAIDAGTQVSFSSESQSSSDSESLTQVSTEVTPTAPDFKIPSYETFIDTKKRKDLSSLEEKIQNLRAQIDANLAKGRQRFSPVQIQRPTMPTKAELESRLQKLLDKTSVSEEDYISAFVDQKMHSDSSEDAELKALMVETETEALTPIQPVPKSEKTRAKKYTKTKSTPKKSAQEIISSDSEADSRASKASAKRRAKSAERALAKTSPAIASDGALSLASTDTELDYNSLISQQPTLLFEVQRYFNFPLFQFVEEDGVQLFAPILEEDDSRTPSEINVLSSELVKIEKPAERIKFYLERTGKQALLQNQPNFWLEALELGFPPLIQSKGRYIPAGVMPKERVDALSSLAKELSKAPDAKTRQLIVNIIRHAELAEIHVPENKLTFLAEAQIFFGLPDFVQVPEGPLTPAGDFSMANRMKLEKLAKSLTEKKSSEERSKLLSAQALGVSEQSYEAPEQAPWREIWNELNPDFALPYFTQDGEAIGIENPLSKNLANMVWELLSFASQLSKSVFKELSSSLKTDLQHYHQKLQHLNDSTQESAIKNIIEKIKDSLVIENAKEKTAITAAAGGDAPEPSKSIEKVLPADGSPQEAYPQEWRELRNLGVMLPALELQDGLWTIPADYIEDSSRLSKAKLTELLKNVKGQTSEEIKRVTMLFGICPNSELSIQANTTDYLDMMNAVAQGRFYYWWNEAKLALNQQNISTEYEISEHKINFIHPDAQALALQLLAEPNANTQRRIEIVNKQIAAIKARDLSKIQPPSVPTPPPLPSLDKVVPPAPPLLDGMSLPPPPPSLDELAPAPPLLPKDFSLSPILPKAPGDLPFLDDIKNVKFKLNPPSATERPVETKRKSSLTKEQTALISELTSLIGQKKQVTPSEIIDERLKRRKQQQQAEKTEVNDWRGFLDKNKPIQKPSKPLSSDDVQMKAMVNVIASSESDFSFSGVKLRKVAKESPQVAPKPQTDSQLNELKNLLQKRRVDSASPPPPPPSKAVEKELPSDQRQTQPQGWDKLRRLKINLPELIFNSTTRKWNKPEGVTGGPRTTVVQAFFDAVEANLNDEEEVLRQARHFGIYTDPNSSIASSQLEIQIANLAANTYWWREARIAIKDRTGDEVWLTKNTENQRFYPNSDLYLELMNELLALPSNSTSQQRTEIINSWLTIHADKLRPVKSPIIVKSPVLIRVTSPSPDQSSVEKETVDFSSSSSSSSSESEDESPIKQDEKPSIDPSKPESSLIDQASKNIVSDPAPSIALDADSEPKEISDGLFHLEFASPFEGLPLDTEVSTSAFEDMPFSWRIGVLIAKLPLLVDDPADESQMHLAPAHNALEPLFEELVQSDNEDLDINENISNCLMILLRQGVLNTKTVLEAITRLMNLGLLNKVSEELNEMLYMSQPPYWRMAIDFAQAPYLIENEQGDLIVGDDEDNAKEWQNLYQILKAEKKPELIRAAFISDNFVSAKIANSKGKIPSKTVEALEEFDLVSSEQRFAAHPLLASLTSVELRDEEIVAAFASEEVDTEEDEVSDSSMDAKQTEKVVSPPPSPTKPPVPEQPMAWNILGDLGLSLPNIEQELTEDGSVLWRVSDIQAQDMVVTLPQTIIDKLIKKAANLTDPNEVLRLAMYLGIRPDPFDNTPENFERANSGHSSYWWNEATELLAGFNLNTNLTKNDEQETETDSGTLSVLLTEILKNPELTSEERKTVVKEFIEFVLKKDLSLKSKEFLTSPSDPDDTADVADDVEIKSPLLTPSAALDSDSEPKEISDGLFHLANASPFDGLPLDTEVTTSAFGDMPFSWRIGVLIARLPLLVDDPTDESQMHLAPAHNALVPLFEDLVQSDSADLDINDTISSCLMILLRHGVLNTKTLLEAITRLMNLGLLNKVSEDLNEMLYMSQPPYWRMAIDFALAPYLIENEQGELIVGDDEENATEWQTLYQNLKVQAEPKLTIFAFITDKFVSTKIANSKGKIPKKTVEALEEFDLVSSEQRFAPHPLSESLTSVELDDDEIVNAFASEEAED